MATPPDGFAIELGDVAPDGRSVAATVHVDDAVITRATIRKVIDQACPLGIATDTGIDAMTDAVCALLSVPGPEITDPADLQWGDVVVDSDCHRFLRRESPVPDGVDPVPWFDIDDDTGRMWVADSEVEWPVFLVSRRDTDG